MTYLSDQQLARVEALQVARVALAPYGNYPVLGSSTRVTVKDYDLVCVAHWLLTSEWPVPARSLGADNPS